MPYYKCTFVDEHGRFKHRTVFSDGRAQLRETFRDSDEKLFSVRQALFHNLTRVNLFSRKIGYSEFLLFNQKLITLLRAGVPFNRALGIIIENSREGVLKTVLDQIHADIRNGMQISEAFSSAQIPFQRIYRASLMAGEKSGNLEAVLEKFNRYLEKITLLRRKTLSSLSYPVILFVFMIAMVLLILLYAIPKFSSFYESFEAQLPTTTRLLISTAEWMQDHILLFVLPVGGLYAGLKILEKTHRRVVVFDWLKLQIPFIGRIILENAMAIFSRTLSILISGGIPVPEATGIAVGTLSNRHLLKKAENLTGKIKEGNLLSGAWPTWITSRA